MPPVQRSSTIRTIGVVANINHAYGRSLLRGVNAYFESNPHKYIVDLFIHERNLLECKLEAYDGIVCSTEEERLTDLPTGLPVINLESSSRNPYHRGFQVNNHRVGELAAETLYAEGALSFLYYDGFEPFHGLVSQRSSQQRRSGFQAGYETLIAEASRSHRQITGATSRKDLSNQLSTLPRPVGVFCFNDAAAVEAAEVCRYSGLNVPKDVLLIGVDNDELLCALSTPWITSIDTGVAKLASLAVGAIVEHIECGNSLKKSESVEPILLRRESTGTLTPRGTVTASAVNVIDQVEAKELSPAYIAQSIGCSIRSLNQLLKGELNTTAQDLIAERVIRDAKRLLRETENSIEAISAISGREPASFHQLFKRYEQLSPGEYRKRFRTLTGQKQTPTHTPKSSASTTIGMISPLGKSDRILLSGVETYMRSNPKLNNVRILIKIDSVENFIGDPTYTDYTDAFIDECDGLIAASQAKLPSKIPASKPVVTIDHNRTRENAWSIYSDNAEIGAMAARYFIKKGYRNFAYSGYSVDVLREGIISHAQAKLSAPGGWQVYNWGTDNFNDYDIGWQWSNVAPNWFLFEESTSGPSTLSKFRTQNVVMTGDHLRLINWYHDTPVTEQGRTFTDSGGWLQSKATWLTEGQFQAQTKVDWNFADVWPSFWTTYSSGGAGDELDIMEYQSNILNHSHHVWSNGNSNNPSKRLWAPWMNPTWHHTWAMERVRSWSNWACRTTRNTQATFYINGKLEHTSNQRKATSPMVMHFSTSPHRDHRPAPGNYPDFRVNWVETHIP